MIGANEQYVTCPGVSFRPRSTSRNLPGEMPGLWGEAGEGVAVAEQGAVFEAVRGGGGGGLRERVGPASGAPFRVGGEHGAGHRSPLCGTMGPEPTETRLATN